MRWIRAVVAYFHGKQPESDVRGKGRLAVGSWAARKPRRHPSARGPRSGVATCLGARTCLRRPAPVPISRELRRHGRGRPWPGCDCTQRRRDNDPQSDQQQDDVNGGHPAERHSRAFSGMRGQTQGFGRRLRGPGFWTRLAATWSGRAERRCTESPPGYADPAIP